MSEPRSERPQLHLLLQALKPLPWTDIKQLAIQLRVELKALDNIETQRRSEECGLYAMNEWLSIDTEASWNKVVSALQDISKNKVAKDIEDKYCTPAARNSMPSTPPQPHAVSPQPIPAEAKSTPLSHAAPLATSTTRLIKDDPNSITSSACAGVRAGTQVLDAAQLDCKFVTLVADTKSCFQRKEQSDVFFLSHLKNMLTHLPLSTLHNHRLFLIEKQEIIKNAKDVDGLFEILKPYWNYSDYALLEHILKKFGTMELQDDMRDYIAALEELEKNTTVEILQDTLKCKVELPKELETMKIVQGKDPTKYTLHEVRQLQNEVINSAALQKYSLFRKSTSASSVEIVLAFPPEAFADLQHVFNDQFRRKHEITSVFFSRFFPPRDVLQEAVLMSDTLNGRVLNSLEGTNRPLSTLEIAHAVGLQTREQVNPILYALEKAGKIRKVNNIPPTWSLLRSEHLSKQQQSELTSDISPGATVPGDSGVEVQVVSFLSKSHRPCTALEIAKGLGYKTRKEINPHLYAMAKDGLITLIDGKGAPQWCVPCENTASLTSAHSTSPPLVSISKQSIPSTVDLSHIPMENVQQRLLAVASGTSIVYQEEEPMETELTVEDHVLAALKSKPGVGITSLELAKTVGMNTTRLQVSSIMENLQMQGKVRCLYTEPQQWVLAETDPLHPTASATAVSSISDLTGNPVSALNEYCQSKQIELTFPVVGEYGPPHRKTFVIAATFGGNQFKAESSRKVKARQMAADLALQSIRASAAKPASVGVPTQVPSQPRSFPDMIANMSHFSYLQLEQAIQYPQPGRRVIAAFVMENTEKAHMEVVATGSGNQCITGDNISSKGLVVNDSHAEVVARRSLMRFFYKELLAKTAHRSTIFVDSESAGLAEIPDNLKFHLYISTAPCGDGALFSRDNNENRVPPADNSHKPTMTNKKQGILRTKMEGGEGTIPVGESSQQTWDGILRGNRLRTMSCSDKILRWNVLGLQGALLARFMKPVYMSSLTLGSLHHHGHLSRAVCCRASELESNLPVTFAVNHPTIGRVQGGDEMERHTEKTSNFSLNWALGDDKAELTDGVRGMPVSHVPSSESHSRISKACLFSMFVTLCKESGCRDIVSMTTYSDAKKGSLAYQQAKLQLFEHFKKKGYGNWVKKPDELEQFTIEND